MSKVYFFTADDDHGGVYIAAKTWKEAREIARLTWLNEVAENFTDYKGHIIKSINTEYHGELNLKQIQELGLLWFDCTECGEQSFTISENDMEYSCSCGYRGDVPYV